MKRVASREASAMLTHPIPPLYDPARPPRILILGSFPSVKSRETAFFYGHPQNRFWRVMASVLNAEVPTSVEEKSALLMDHGIALWDVIAACEIEGSADSTIRAIMPTDLSPLLASGTVQAVFTNGTTASRLYRLHQQPLTGISAVPLPSTSPANARIGLAELTAAWTEAIRPYLHELSLERNLP